MYLTRRATRAAWGRTGQYHKDPGHVRPANRRFASSCALLVGVKVTTSQL